MPRKRILLEESTGNALSCAAAVETQKVIHEEGLVENSQRMGDRLKNNLRSIQQSEVSKGLIGDVRGLGLMVGVEFTKEAEPDIKAKISQACVLHIKLLDSSQLSTLPKKI